MVYKLLALINFSLPSPGVPTCERSEQGGIPRAKHDGIGGKNLLVFPDCTSRLKTNDKR